MAWFPFPTGRGTRARGSAPVMGVGIGDPGIRPMADVREWYGWKWGDLRHLSAWFQEYDYVFFFPLFMHFVIFVG